MTLLDTVRQLKDLKANLTIFARRPWTPDAEALVAEEPDGGELPREAAAIRGEYFLEVSLAQEFVDDWLESRPGSSAEQTCERLIQYAENDA